jgi:hypothetical protein
VVVEGDALVFQPETVRAAGMTVPGYLADSLWAGTAFRYPVEGLPYGGKLIGRRPWRGPSCSRGGSPGWSSAVDNATVCC